MVIFKCSHNFISGKEYGMDYVYNAQGDGSLVAVFSFVDVDGNTITGMYQNDNIADILDGLGYGYLYNEMLHPVKGVFHGNFNGIVDTSKPVHITIMPYSAPV